MTCFQQPFLKPGDNCWFYFSGHGERDGDRDYLMPIDANARGDRLIAALPVSQVREWLLNSGADNVIMILDACRTRGRRSGGGIGEEIQRGVITIASCQPTQVSWEEDSELQQGIFTYALLEALRLPGERSCATVERLNDYLKRRVPELCDRFHKAPAQNPRIAADPAERYHYILLPRYARNEDIARLKSEAARLAFYAPNKNLELAEQICIRAIAASSGRDQEAIDLLTEIRVMRRSNSTSTPPTPPASNTGGKTSPPPPEPTFEFEVVTVDARGQISDRRISRAEYRIEDLGNGVNLEMVLIPGGTFQMGGKEFDKEQPIHSVKIRNYSGCKQPSSPSPFSQVGRRGTGPVQSPSPHLGEGFRVRAD